MCQFFYTKFYGEKNTFLQININDQRNMLDRPSGFRLSCHLRVELCSNVGGVADDGDDHGPLDGQLGDHQGGDEEAGMVNNEKWERVE